MDGIGVRLVKEVAVSVDAFTEEEYVSQFKLYKEFISIASIDKSQTFKSPNVTSKASIPQITYSNELIYGEKIYVSSNGLPVKATCFEPAVHSFYDVALKLVGCFMKEKVEDGDEINDSLPKDKEPDYMQSAFRNYLCSGCTVSLTLVLDESFDSMHRGKLLADIVSTLAVPRPEAVSSINRTV
nr:DnaJ homolog subfamily C member 2-like [Tanacetum cinerariifolium]